MWQRLAAWWRSRRARAAHRLDRPQDWTMRSDRGRRRIDGTYWL